MPVLFCFFPPSPRQPTSHVLNTAGPRRRREPRRQPLPLSAAPSPAWQLTGQLGRARGRGSRWGSARPEGKRGPCSCRSRKRTCCGRRRATEPGAEGGKPGCSVARTRRGHCGGTTRKQQRWGCGSPPRRRRYRLPKLVPRRRPSEGL